MKPVCAVIVFAKAPVPGYAKTRLARVLGAEAAARLAARMLAETLREAMAAGIGPVELCCAPDETHPAFRQAVSEHPLALTQQGDGDLGARMQRAFLRALTTHDRALLIGTDAPALDAMHLRTAAAALQSHAAVVTPAFDGGYALIGLSRAMPTPFDVLFSDMAWSTSNVMAHTRGRLSHIGIDHAELPTLHDVDEPEDLIHLPREWLA